MMTGNQKKQLWVLFLLGLASRLIFVYWNQGEYTDGILQLTLFSSAASNTFFMPLYTVLAEGLNCLFRDMELSGKLVSMISGVAGIFPVYFMARRLKNHRAGVLAAALYLVSPEIWRWHNRVMTDALFNTLFLWCLAHLVAVWNSQDDGESIIKHLGFAWLAGGLAVLTRYQGMALFPILGWMTVRRKVSFKVLFKPSNLSVWVTAFVSWVMLPLWWSYRGSGHMGQYMERTATDTFTTLAAYLTMGEGFVTFFPYVATYPVFIVFLYALFCGHWNRSFKFMIGLLVYLWMAWLAAHAPFQSFQFRYFLPLISLTIVVSACGAIQLQEINNRVWRKSVVGFLILYSLLFAIVSLYVQRGTFGDIHQAADYMRDKLAGKRIFDNEIYRQGTTNSKIRFWSGLPVEYYDLALVQPGDYICLHNIQTDLAYELGQINRRFVIIPEAQFTARTLPLLPDIMVTPQVTSRPEALLYRYFPQSFETVIIRVESRP